MPNILEAATNWPPTVVSVGVTTPARTRAIQGPLDAIYPLASVTKPLAGWAVLVAAEHGHLALDDHAGPHGATIAHLLSHASGLAPEAGGKATDPGKRRVYSNQAYDLLGEITAAATDRTFATWLRDSILAPLGMDSTSLDGSPAKDGHSTVRDLLAFGRELLTPTLISADLHERATSPQWPDLDGVLPGYGRQSPNPWGLGVEIRGTKSPHWTGPDAPPQTFGHFGQAGSYLWVDREAGLACACLTGTPFGQWAIDAWAPFNQDVLDHFA